MLRAAVAALFLLCGVAALAADARVEPRSAVSRVAALLRAEYFDAAKAARIANGLEADAARGAFDGLTDPRDLAGELTRRLRPEDGHFGVIWRPDADGGPAGPGPRRPDPALERRGNHGFLAAQILPGGVGYVRLDQFAHFDTAGDPAQLSADRALAFVSGAPALIIDLRENGGGSPAMVGYLAAHFLAEPEKAANVFKSRRGPDQRELPPVMPVAGAQRLEGPLFVLVSARTASAAEALAYTLQAAKRATIVGEASAGAANPGGPQRTVDGLEIFIPFGTPVNPLTGGNWEGSGVKPDVAVPQADALRVAQIRALEAEGGTLPAGAVLVLQTLKADGGRVPGDLAGIYGDLAITGSDGKAMLQQGRRPPRTLVLVGPDLLSSVEDPMLRLRVERDSKTGAAVALVRDLPGGGSVRLPRGPAQ
jgi:hypothetical protein